MSALYCSLFASYYAFYPNGDVDIAHFMQRWLEMDVLRFVSINGGMKSPFVNYFLDYFPLQFKMILWLTFDFLLAFGSRIGYYLYVVELMTWKWLSICKFPIILTPIMIMTCGRETYLIWGTFPL